MIEITYMGSQTRLVNPDLIEYIETVPDTMLVMVNGHRYMVTESPDTIVERIVSFRRLYLRNSAVAAATNPQRIPIAEAVSGHERNLEEAACQPPGGRAAGLENRQSE